MGDQSGIFPGVGLAVILLTIILSVPIARGLLWAYRRAMLAAMLRRAPAAGAAGARGQAARTATPPRQQLVIEMRERVSSQALVPTANETLRRTLWRPRATALVYCLAGLAHAAVVTVVWLLILDDGLYATRTTVLLWTFAWPLVLTVNLILDANWRGQFRNALVYLACLPLLVPSAWLFSYLVRLIAGRDLIPTSTGFMIFWDVMLFALIFLALTAGPAALLILFALLHRSLRAIGVMAVALIFAGFAGVFTAFALVFFTPDMESAPGTRIVAHIAVFVREVAPFNVDRSVILVFILGILAFVAFAGSGLIGWRLLCWLSGRYERKQLSDQALLIDGMWLMVTLLAALRVTPDGTRWAVVMLLSFVAYKGVSVAGIAVVDGLTGNRPANHRLLLLRVFGSQRRSEQLMALVGARWRYAGSIQLIAGTDLATANLEPHEFLDFVRGKLASRYVRDLSDLERHLGEMDLRPDPGGRFRVNEFFCYDDTWRPTLSRLAACSDAVLMDLRGFSALNQGVVHELHELVDVVPLSRVVLITDDTTDHECLRDTLGRAWHAMAADSPNRASHRNRVVVCNLARDDMSGARLVLARLAQAAALEPAAKPADLAAGELPGLGELVPGTRPAEA